MVAIMSVIKEVFDCETLITEVEKRPPLYDFQLKEYCDKNIKEKLWSEVCEAVVSDWNILSPQDKKEKGKKHIVFERKISIMWFTFIAVTFYILLYCHETAPWGLVKYDAK